MPCWMFLVPTSALLKHQLLLPTAIRPRTSAMPGSKIHHGACKKREKKEAKIKWGKKLFLLPMNIHINCICIVNLVEQSPRINMIWIKQKKNYIFFLHLYHKKQVLKFWNLYEGFPVITTLSWKMCEKLLHHHFTLTTTNSSAKIYSSFTRFRICKKYSHICWGVRLPQTCLSQKSPKIGSFRFESV